jgi:hypothetical protein
VKHIVICYVHPYTTILHIRAHNSIRSL